MRQENDGCCGGCMPAIEVSYWVVRQTITDRRKALQLAAYIKEMRERSELGGVLRRQLDEDLMNLPIPRSAYCDDKQKHKGPSYARCKGSAHNKKTIKRQLKGK